MKFFIVAAFLLVAQTSCAPLSILNPLGWFTNAAQFGLDLANHGSSFGYDATIANLNIAKTLSEIAYAVTINNIKTFEDNVDKLINDVNTAINNVNDVVQDQIGNVQTQTQNNALTALQQAQQTALQVQQTIDNIISNTQNNLNNVVNNAAQNAEQLINDVQSTGQEIVSNLQSEAEEAAQKIVVNSISDIFNTFGTMSTQTSISPDEMNNVVSRVLQQTQGIINTYQQLASEDLPTAHEAVTNILQAVERMLTAMGLDTTAVKNVKEMSDNAFASARS